jgi:hypothetical protein
MPERLTHDPLKAQISSASGRSSKVIKDREAIEVLVEVSGRGSLVLRVDSGGGYSLRGRPEGKEAGETKSQDLIAVGVVSADEIVAIRPEQSSVEHEL